MENIKRTLHICSLLPLLAASGAYAQTQNLPNIVLIMADDFGFECIGANGGNYHTPRIDRLAEEGIRFENCHSNPLSTPSRVQLMTGKYNVKNYISFGELDRKEITFANLLKKTGYATCISGKWQLGKQQDSPQHFGFDHSCLWQQTKGAVDDSGSDTRYTYPVMDVDGRTVEFSPEDFGPDIACNYAIDFIRTHKESPFFLYYPMMLTHCPFVATPDTENVELKRSPTYKGNAIYYPDMVSYTDKIVGRILDELDRLHLRENTLVIFTGDNGTDKPVVSMLHGKPYPGGKGQTIDSGTHVPLIVSAPGGLKNHVNHQLIDFTDFLPTLCEAAHIACPTDKELDGKSFYPQLKGDTTDVRKWVYCWYAPRKVHDSNAAVFARNTQYKLYRNGAFYDVKADFEEQHPISPSQMSEEQKKVAAELKAVIDSYEPFAKQKK